MKKCNIGVIGLGRLGYQHALNVTKTTGAVLAAVSDGFPAALERAVNDFDVKGYADYKEMIASPDVDAIVVATPTQTHFPILMDCIATGKPIFCEKPITFTTEEAEKIEEAVAKTGVYLQVGFMRRYDPGHVAAKKMISDGKCGKPIYFHDCQRDPNGPPPAYVPQSGGLFVDMAIHDLDVARWMMGSEIKELYATGAVLKHEYLKELNDIDDGQILLRFENGAIGMIEISRNANNVYDTRTEVIGLEKSVFTGQEQMTPYKVIGDEEITYDMSNWCLGRFKDAYLDEMEAFVSNVLNGKPSEVTAYDGKMGIKLALAATESYRTGKWVAIK
ncbi:MAG: Gfo/Idh/MocA family oxidoreductase [Eubacteriales bacterium]|nr:Gfo/Idh/MocA family oxidoreductase [Eubacteriales bacterium]